MPKKSGFTLIELLVVITIIAILSVIGMTVYSSLTTKAKDIKKKSNIDQIASVYELRYDTKSHKYKALTDEDFSNNKPDTTNYTGVLNQDAKTFNICTTLSDNTTYCKESTHQASVVFVPPVVIPTPTPTPTPTPLTHIPPSVTTLAASSIQSDSAILNSQLTNNDPSSTMGSWYRYGTTNTNNCSTLPDSIAAASFSNTQTSPVSNPITLQQLLANATYYFCAIAGTVGGTVYGNILSFSTPPASCSSGLLTNGCFENQLNNWLCQGASTGTAGICIADSGTKYAGNYSAKVFGGTNVWGWQLAQGGITASANEQFCLAARVKKGVANDLVFIAIQETADPWRSVSLATQNTTDWQLVRLTVTRPADWSSSTIQVYLRTYYDNSTDWFDDVSLTRGACL